MKIEAGQVWTCTDGSASEVLEIHPDGIRFRQLGRDRDGYGQEGEVYSFTRRAFETAHPSIVSAAPPESPILAMVPAAARGSVVRVDWMDEHGNLCRVECTGPAAPAAPASPQDLPGGLTADQVHEIARRTRESMAEGTGLRGRKDTWDTGYDVGAEFVLGLLSEHVGEDL